MQSTIKLLLKLPISRLTRSKNGSKREKESKELRSKVRNKQKAKAALLSALSLTLFQRINTSTHGLESVWEITAASSSRSRLKICALRLVPLTCVSGVKFAELRPIITSLRALLMLLQLKQKLKEK